MVENLEQALLRIAELEEKIEDQQILIDALISQIKKRPQKQSTLNLGLEYGGSQDKSSKLTPVDKEELSSTELKKEENVPKKDIMGVQISLDEEVENIFRSKKVSRSFKDNLTFETFIAHSRDCHNFSLNNKTEIKTKNPINTYIKQNMDKIIRHLMINLNTYDLNIICSSFNLISGDVDYQYKLVIAHDIVLFIDDFSKMPFVISALFNNQHIRDDTLGRTLKQILAHQYAVDCDVYKDFPNLTSHYSKIMDNFEIQPSEKSLESICEELVEDFEVFEDGILNPEIFPSMYAVRMLCHYMDWDFTYNKFIHSTLYPKLRKSKNPLHCIYILTLAFNALRIFGRIESVDIVFSKLEELMADPSELSTVIYLFIKQINPEKANRWFDTYAGKIGHASAAYIEELLLY